MVLAAGGARRYGRPKLLRRIGTESLLVRSVSCATTLTPGRCVVVLGCAASLLSRELRNWSAVTVVNRRWREGLSSSLRAGLLAVPPQATAVLVILADQFALRPSDLRRLAAAWSREPRRPAAAEFGGRLGAPAILPRIWFAGVATQRGDQGARRILRDPALDPVPVSMPAAAMDLDARADLAALRRLARRPRALLPRRLD